MSRTKSDGRPKQARTLIVVKLEPVYWTRVISVLHKNKLEEQLAPIKAQVEQAAKYAKTETRECVHGLPISKRGKPKRMACSLCEKRVESGKNLLA